MRTTPASRISVTGSPSRPSSRPAPPISNRPVAPLATASASSTPRRKDEGRMVDIGRAPLLALLPGGARRLVDEAGDGLEAVAGDDAEIDARGDGSPALGRQLPGKADAVVVGVDRARPPEAVLGEPLLHRLHHRVDAGMAVAGDEGVLVARVRGPGGGDQVATAPGVRLVPHRDVAIGQFGHAAHLGSPCLVVAAAGVAAVSRARRIAREGAPVDYVRGKGSGRTCVPPLSSRDFAKRNTRDPLRQMQRSVARPWVPALALRARPG